MQVPPEVSYKGVEKSDAIEDLVQKQIAKLAKTAKNIVSVHIAIEKNASSQRRDVKSHPQNQVMAYVEKLFRDKGYGFLRSLDGQQVYFHKNSCLHGEW